MSFGVALRNVVDQNVRILGDQLRLTLRRISTLKNRTTGDALNSLTIATAALAAATVIDLTGTNLDGELPAGCTFTIAGHSPTYAATNTTEASQDTNDRLVSVAITPGLELAVSPGAVVTIVQAYSDQPYNALRAEVEEGLAQPQVEGRRKRVRLAAAVGVRAPRRGDLLIDGSETDEVTGVGKSKPGLEASWVVEAGAGG